MESAYDSDMSDDTRVLVEPGLAINRKKYSSRAGHHTDAYSLAPNRDMDTSNIPHAGRKRESLLPMAITRPVWNTLGAKIVTLILES